MNQTLSENFIREFQDKVDWKMVSSYQTLSENFIREFQDIVDWSKISHFQHLSKKFITEFQDKVDWRFLRFNEEIDFDPLELKDKLCK